VLGRKHVGTTRNTLLLSNHQSMLDSFLVGLAAYGADCLHGLGHGWWDSRQQRVARHLRLEAV